MSKQFHLTQEIMMIAEGRSYSVQYTNILTYIYMSSAVSRHSDPVTLTISTCPVEEGAACVHVNASTSYCVNGTEAETGGMSGQGCVRERLSESHNKRFEDSL